MSPLKSILLHLDPSPRSEVRLLLARELAVRHAAALTALYATAPSLLDLPFAMSQDASGAQPALTDLYDSRRADARRVFESNRAALPEMAWRELEGEPVAAGVARLALLADLLVLGQHDPNDSHAIGVPADFVASVLMASGRPAVIIPFAGAFATLGREVLVAWKPTRESARALWGSLPLLQSAQRIHVTTAATSSDGRADITELENWLRLNEVSAHVVPHAALPADTPGEALLSLAADIGADLLVMGCYGHSRARELVLGGASRTVLNSMTLPVLMAH